MHCHGEKPILSNSTFQVDFTAHVMRCQCSNAGLQFIFVEQIMRNS
jgi:hypothetical protein